jgi:hypothetical protein
MSWECKNKYLCHSHNSESGYLQNKKGCGTESKKKVEVANEYLQNNIIKKSYFLKSAIFRFVGTGT